MITLTNGKYSCPADSKSFINNVTCYLQQDFNTVVTSDRPTEVLVICLDQGGFGDIVFGIKFTEYLLNAFPGVRVTVISQNRNGNDFVSFISKEFPIDLIKSHDYQTGNIKYGTGSRVTVLGVATENPYESNIPEEAGINPDIVFVAPAVRDFTLRAAFNMATICNNNYSFSEYNLGSGEDIETGVPTGNGKQVGLLFNSYDKYFQIPQVLKALLNRRRYSICYFYTDDTNVTSTVIDTSSRQYQLLNNHKATALYNLAICFSEYLDLLDSMRVNGEDLAVLVKHDTIKHFLAFFKTNEAVIPSLPHKDLLIKIKGILSRGRTSEPGIQLIDFCPVNKDEMLALYQHSLPTVFISGDQSLTDFVSVNKYFVSDVFYQTFRWKKVFAEALGIPMDFSCGRIPGSTLNELATHPNADFRMKGMAIVESVLICSRLGRPGGCALYNTTAVDPLGTAAKSNAVFDILAKKDAILYNATIVGLNTVQLVITNPSLAYFNIYYKQSSGNTAIASLYKGSSGGNIYVTIYPYEVQPVNHACQSLLLPMKQESGVYIYPVALFVAMIAIVINGLIKTDKYASNLPYTYATLDSQCLGLGNTGMVVCSEFMATSKSLPNFTTTDMWDVKSMAEILYQVLYVIKAFGRMSEKLVHNNLHPSNVFIEILPSALPIPYNTNFITRYLVKITDFSKASYTGYGFRIASSQAVQRQYDPDTDKNTFLSGFNIPFLQSLTMYKVDKLISACVSVLKLVKQKEKLGRYPESDFQAVMEQYL